MKIKVKVVANTKEKEVDEIGCSVQVKERVGIYMDQSLQIRSFNKFYFANQKIIPSFFHFYYFLLVFHIIFLLININLLTLLELSVEKFKLFPCLHTLPLANSIS